MMVRKPLEGSDEKRHLRDSVLAKFIRKGAKKDYGAQSSRERGLTDARQEEDVLEHDENTNKLKTSRSL